MAWQLLLRSHEFLTLAKLGGSCEARNTLRSHSRCKARNVAISRDLTLRNRRDAKALMLRKQKSCEFMRPRLNIFMSLRSPFLRNIKWFVKTAEFCILARCATTGSILGFLCARRVNEGLSFQPFYANDLKIAERLLIKGCRSKFHVVNSIKNETKFRLYVDRAFVDKYIPSI